MAHLKKKPEMHIGRHRFTSYPCTQVGTNRQAFSFLLSLYDAKMQQPLSTYVLHIEIERGRSYEKCLNILVLKQAFLMLQTSEGRGFESRHRILDGHFTQIFVVKIVLLEKDEYKRKRGRGWPIFLKKNIALKTYSSVSTSAAS